MHPTTEHLNIITKPAWVYMSHAKHLLWHNWWRVEKTLAYATHLSVELLEWQLCLFVLNDLFTKTGLVLGNYVSMVADQPNQMVCASAS